MDTLASVRPEPPSAAHNHAPRPTVEIGGGNPEPSRIATTSLVLVGATVVLSTAVIAPVLPAISAHFADDPRTSYLVPMLVTLPALTIALTAPFAGYVLDRFGRHTAVLVALFVFLASGAAGGFGWSLEWLLATRAVLGMSVAFLMSGFTSMVGDLYGPVQRSRILGRQATLNAVMALVMTMAGGILAEWDWRGMFLVYLLAAPLVYMFARYVPRTGGARSAASEAEGRRQQTPARWSVIGAIFALGILCMIFAMLVPTRSPYLIEREYAGTAIVIAFAMSIFTVGMAPGAMSFPYLRARMSSWTLFSAGFASLGAGYLLQGVSPSLAILIVGMGISGFGFGLIMPNLNTSLLAASPAHLRGRLSGGLVSSIFIGQFMSPLVSQPMVDRYDIQGSFIAGTVMMTVVTLACLLPAARRLLRS